MEKSEIKILEQDFDNYKSLEVNYHDINQIRGFKITLTIPLNSLPQVRFDVKCRKPLPDYMVCGAAYIVSKKLKELLEEFNAKAEFFSVEIYLTNDDKFVENYYYFHLLAEEDCFDFENSEYETEDDDDSIDSIKKLVLKFTSAPENEIFFIAEIDFRIVCLTKQICRAIEENEITGIKLADPDKLTW